MPRTHYHPHRDAWRIAFVTALAALSMVERAPAATNFSPVLTASMNESVSSNLERGRPLLLEVALLHPHPFDTNAPPLLIDAGAGRWSDAVRIEVRDTNNQVRVWPMILFSSVSNSITLNSNIAGQLVYYITPEDTARFDLGPYTIQAWLNTTNSTNTQAWKGVAVGGPLDVNVRDEPGTLSPAEQELKQQLLASYHLLRDDVTAANADIDGLLASQSNNITGLSFKSYLFQSAERYGDALKILSSAIELVYASSPDGEEPPVNLIQRRNQLLTLPQPISIRSVVAQLQRLTFAWNSTPGEKYNIEASPDLRAWSSVATNLVADSELFSWTTNLGPQTIFCRIRK